MNDAVTEQVSNIMHEIFNKQGALQALGARIVHIGRGTCETLLPMSPAASQHHGFFHGGVIGTLGDATGGLTANSLMLPDYDCLAVEYKINFLAPAKGEALIGRGKILRAGKTLAVTSVELLSLNQGVEKLCAVMQQTVFAIEQK
ncbi:MAG: PaaI family thioesterase [Proteobacteria bacterium]|nr:PaaI family thioesterase [Pseudomonadota bacterium]